MNIDIELAKLSLKQIININYNVGEIYYVLVISYHHISDSILQL
jgi:hypothetical protein